MSLNQSGIEPFSTKQYKVSKPHGVAERSVKNPAECQKIFLSFPHGLCMADFSAKEMTLNTI